MKKKRTMILMITLALTIVLIGSSYAYFSVIFEDNKPVENNTLNTELLSDTVMISDVENGAGSFKADRIYPGHKEVASIKINVTGKENSKIGIKFIYDVEENGLNDHIRISIYKSKKKIETKENYFNCKTIINTESETAKYYETCEEKDLELFIGEKILSGGKEELDVVTDTILITEEGQPEEYYYYAVVEFINIETSQNEDMDKVLKGKINVEVVPPEKKTFEESVVAYGKLGNNIAKSMLYSSYLDQENLLYDETIDNNLRYVGASPNNYVLFNDELWRIIGVMNNVEDESGIKDSRIKLIRDESIGEYSWDTSSSNVNSGYGVNEWSQADLMKLMNPGYEKESVGGSLYWNRAKGNCYNGQSNAATSCDFSQNGLLDSSKEMIETIKWSTASNGTVAYNNIKASEFYNLERSENSGKICSSGKICNESVPRNTFHLSQVGLSYPSDAGFATSGGTISREICLSKTLYSWREMPECNYSSWFYNLSIDQNLLFYYANKEASIGCYRLSGKNDGYPYGGSCYYKSDTFPTIFLKKNIQITNGEGTITTPYILGTGE